MLLDVLRNYISIAIASLIKRFIERISVSSLRFSLCVFLPVRITFHNIYKIISDQKEFDGGLFICYEFLTGKEIILF